MSYSTDNGLALEDSAQNQIDSVIWTQKNYSMYRLIEKFLESIQLNLRPS